ncbi:hypothetical protein ACJX0J_015623, partial [Zea mays]
LVMGWNLQWELKVFSSLYLVFPNKKTVSYGFRGILNMRFEFLLFLCYGMNIPYQFSLYLRGEISQASSLSLLSIESHVK